MKKFTKSAFDLDDIVTAASELKYTRAIKQLIAKELQEPSEDFVRFFATQVYSGRLMQQVREQFAVITKRALQQYINERINQRLESALAGEPSFQAEEEVEDAGEAEEPEEQKSKIETTEEEREAFYIVKSIMREVVDPERIAMRDVVSYCGILLDDNNRQPICRLHFNTTQKYIGLFDEEKNNEERVPIDTLDEIYQHADWLRAAVKLYE